MSITFLSNPIHLPEFFKFDREYLGKQESQNEDQKVFHKDTLEDRKSTRLNSSHSH